MQHVARLCPFKSHTAVVCPFMQLRGGICYACRIIPIHPSFKCFSQEMLWVDKPRVTFVFLSACWQTVSPSLRCVYHKVNTLCITAAMCESNECKPNTKELWCINLRLGKPFVLIFKSEKRLKLIKIVFMLNTHLNWWPFGWYGMFSASCKKQHLTLICCPLRLIYTSKINIRLDQLCYFDFNLLQSTVCRAVALKLITL